MGSITERMFVTADEGDVDPKGFFSPTAPGGLMNPLGRLFLPRRGQSRLK